MSNRLDPLQQSMVADFHRLLDKSKQLHEMWHILPEFDRQVVQNAYLEWAWQMIFAATSAEAKQPEHIRQFGGFVLASQQGKPARFKTSSWVAMDLKQAMMLETNGSRAFAAHQMRMAILNFQAAAQSRSFEDVRDEYGGYLASKDPQPVNNTLHNMVEHAVAATVEQVRVK